MFNNSNELLEFVLRELQVAIKEEKEQVEILLEQRFPDDSLRVRMYCNNLEIKKITEILREEFKDYNIKGTIESKVKWKGLITLERGPTTMFYPLVWILTLQKK